MCLFLLVWFAAGTQSYAADTSDSNRSAKQEVLEHHQNATRSGLFVVPSLTWDQARNLHRDPNFHADVAGPIYSQPLYWRSPGSAKALLLVVTEQNLVYALDAETGAPVWKTSLGLPVPPSSTPALPNARRAVPAHEKSGPSRTPARP